MINEINYQFRKGNEEFFIEDVGDIKRKPIYDFFKRLIDLFASFLGIIVLSLPMLIIAVIVKCTSKGPAIYKQKRLTKNGKEFNLYKFRSMYIDAEKNGAQWAAKNDSRVTKFGKFMRKVRIDELPQLFNIFVGHMSIVGPRPERPEFYEEFESYIHGFNQRLKVKCGLTGHAQVNGGYDLLPQEKILLDIEYIKKRSFFFDIKIMFQTIGVIFGRKGSR